MRALVDQGSQVSIISEKAAQILSLPRNKCKGIISGVGAKLSNCKGVTNLACQSSYTDFSFETEVYIMNTLIKNLPSYTFNKQAWPHIESIQLSDPDFNVSRPVDILLGAEVYSRIIMDGISRSDANLPIAQQTRLGWILCGNVQTYQCNVILNQVEDIQKYWEIEDISTSSNLSEDDNKCVEYYKTTTTRREDGSYEVRIPFKDNFQAQLGSSKSTAVAQFRQLERKFTTNKHIEQNYKSFINEYLSLGHMTPVSDKHKQGCYLPHHCVLRNDSSTTALRVVFNASRKTTSGLSLNDLMMKGPNLQQDLQSLLLKWRQFRYAFTADIEKMFRFIWVNRQDQTFQKIIWRDSTDTALKEYQLSTVTFGFKSAPFLAMMTLKQLAQDEYQNYKNSDAIQVLEDSFYMDDVLHGAQTVDSAIQLKQDLIKLLKAGGFNLRKWSSNCAQLLQESREDVKQDNFEFKQDDQTKTLGLQWNPTTDTFQFKVKITEANKKVPTKRSILSELSTLYDPLGWLSPISTKLKILFQKVFNLNIQWDDNLPEDLVKEWTSARENLQKIDRFEIPRWLNITSENQEIELHGFSDSSNKSYSCVIYCKTNQGDNKVTLVAAKTRLVSTNKKTTLPRLELCGTWLLAKLMAKVHKCFQNYTIKTYGWTDSMIVLAWLQGDPGRWKPFVANRVRQITEIMPANVWQYVKSAENPADCASRGMSVEQLQDHTLWWNGPTWLPEYIYEQKQDVQKSFTTEEEVKRVKQVYHVSDEMTFIDLLLTKYSSLTKLIKVTAWMLRFIQSLRKTCIIKSSYITLQELNEARHIIIKHVQEKEFPEEMRNLKQNKNLSNKSRLLQFNPYIDSKGIMRIGGRLNKAHVRSDMQHPIILPSKGYFTNLVIDHVHKLTLHGGARVTAANIRQKYWIIGGNRTVKTRIRNCVTCRKHNPSKMYQLMGDLPTQRCNEAKIFHHTGVDFTGHVLIKANKGRGIKTTKGYIAVFVCMVTKLVHIELVSDLTSSAFIAALRRMAARKATPQHIYCDNGSNFVGTSSIMKKQYEETLATFDADFMDEITSMQIEWHFNCPAWPSAGGLWEAAVRSVKHHLRRVIGDQKLTFEEYYTVLAQIEAILNSRPLCPLTEDPNDLEFLTPSSFINLNQNMTLLETETDMRTRWHLTQKIVHDVWKRWRSEYLTQLTARSKWRSQQPNIQINDIVTINEANMPPGKWAMGRVVELHPGSDGHVRVVTLKTKNGLLKRPIIKLSPLPVQHDTNPDSDENN